MFLAANPYFQRRFSHHDNLLRNFRSAIMSVSTRKTGVRPPLT